ncbi:Bug family tripartite tricarboxylate transporter substrate binding protein [Diaphorobacter aerolatus]|uniref:Tripartite tricarboxylate transporter substrate binding protein n=1 Tax=Diaphorobacter aerolatus TaxID=1288495 RepID=A0A7H0GPP9_9BURK|nr:tripartite tricarboxylate transporter substrate binding protein [Diaphorobacter aerolatus]QNP50265.1 tripartite tricarboxylate transporter substrate binding protein [Diaphorobacter aerolatus]
MTSASQEKRRNWCLGVAGWAALSLAHPAALAQALTPLPDFPRQSVTLVSPFPPGGGNDGIARLLGNELSKLIGQAVVIENRAGAGGNLGTTAVARAKPDGYTLVLSQNSVMAVNPSLYKNPGFDPLKDFVALSQITSAPLVLVVRAESPHKSLADYLKAAAERPGKVSFATPGNGTLSHLAGATLAQKKGVTLMHVPYRGAGPATNDLLGGSVDMLITSPPSVESLYSSGKVRALAVTHSNAVGAFKNVPSLEQQGVSHVSIEGWYGVFAPAGTPKERVQYLSEAIRKAATAPAVVARINQDGADVVASTPEALDKKLRAEIPHWAALVKSLDLSID